MNIEFTDYKRFLASIGLALIVLSVAVPWLVLKEPFMIDMKASDLYQLTMLGQFNVHIRQFMALCLSFLSCCISPILFIAGLTLVAIGFPLWMVQETLEDGQEYASKKVEKKTKEVEQEIAKRELEESKSKETQANKAKEYALRQTFKTQIENCFPIEFCELQENRVIVPWLPWLARYDFIIHFPQGISPDILIKVKYTKTSKDLKLVELYFTMLIYTLIGYPAPARAVGIVLHEQSVYSKSDFRFSQRNPFKRTNTEFHDLSELEMSNITCADFLKLFFPSTKPWDALSKES